MRLAVSGGQTGKAQTLAQTLDVFRLLQIRNIDKPVHVLGRTGRRVAPPKVLDRLEKYSAASTGLLDAAKVTVSSGAPSHVTGVFHRVIGGPLLEKRGSFAIASELE